MTEQTKEELEVGGGWEVWCTPFIGATYECIDGSGLTVECTRMCYNNAMLSNVFAGKVIVPRKEHLDCHEGMNYHFLRKAFRMKDSNKKLETKNNNAEKELRISDVIKRKKSGEKLSTKEDLFLHCWLYDNDEEYKKAWEDAVDRTIEKE